jgi:hypothetical protein
LEADLIFEIYRITKMSVLEPVQESQVVQNTPLVVGASLAGLLLGSLIIKRPKPGSKLENHPLCGITTGGQVRKAGGCALSNLSVFIGGMWI